MCCILCFCYVTIIIFSGWVSILYKWSKSADLQLSLHASRALVNLDRDEGTVLYPSGVYLLHPTHRSRSVPAGRVRGDIIMYMYQLQLLGASGRTSGEYCYMYMYLYRNTQLSQSSKERIKGMLFHVLVCTRSSTIKHAYSKAPGTIQRILLHVFTICITLIYINFYFISPFHLSVCLSTEKIWFKSNIHVYSYMNLMSLN